MAAPRGRYLAIIQGGDITVDGRLIEFRARPDELEARLDEELRHVDLDPGVSIVVVRYTQIRMLKVTQMQPAGWTYNFEQERI